ncbi:MAG: DUF4198 domain-containing protein [Campylobacter curvus]
MKRFFKILVVVAALGATSLYAHHFFVIANENSDEPKSATVNIGWGDVMPMDDFFEGNKLQSYAIYDPNLKKFEFKFDKNANIKPEISGKEFPSAGISSGDSYVQKINFNKDAKEGVYQISAVTKRLQFSVWKDKNGKTKWGDVYLDEIKDAQEVTFSLNHQSFAKSYISVGKWSEPKSVGDALEIIPLSDLSTLKVGDEVKFKILTDGKPLASDHDGSPKLKAYGELFGSDDGYAISSTIEDGIVTIKIVAPGRWIVTTNTIKPVDKTNSPELIGKALSAGYNASITFFVK